MMKFAFKIVELAKVPACPKCQNKTSFVYTLDNKSPDGCRITVECGECSFNPIGEPTSLPDGSLMGRYNQVDAIDLWSYAIGKVEVSFDNSRRGFL